MWIAPGGGIDTGEDAVEALRRELEEEVGRGDLPIGAGLFTRSFSIEHRGQVVQAHERYFLVEVRERFEARANALEPDEESWFRRFRWWSPGELEASAAQTSPEKLAEWIDRWRRQQS